jgi:polysaccharide export outer membrane protein
MPDRQGANRFRRGLVAALLTLTSMVATAETAAPGGPAPDLAEQYVLGPGDRVRVVVFGHEDLSGEFSLSANGAVALPLVGAIDGVGKTPAALEAAIAAALSPQFLRNPRVSVEVLSYRPFFILGEVKAPGSYPYAADLSVRSAAALAGGYTYRAKTGHAYITRVIEGHESKQRVAPETPVLPGDIIEVPERFF